METKLIVMEKSDQNLVGKYYFNIKSTAAWKVIEQDNDTGLITCQLVRIATKWSTKHKEFQLGATVQYKISELSTYKNSYSWTFVDNLANAVALYANPYEPMLSLED